MDFWPGARPNLQSFVFCIFCILIPSLKSVEGISKFSGTDFFFNHSWIKICDIRWRSHPLWRSHPHWWYFDFGYILARLKTSEVPLGNFACFDLGHILARFKTSEVPLGNFACFDFGHILARLKTSEVPLGNFACFDRCYIYVNILWIQDNIVSAKCIFCYNAITRRTWLIFQNLLCGWQE